MAPDRPWADEYTLLCERCGYALEGLDPAGACPECGKPIAESLPERRTGTPWQRTPGPRALALTWLLTLVRPFRMLEVVRIQGRPSRSLARWSAAPGLVFFGVFMLLTWIETRGLVIFGRQQRARLTADVAWTVCAHGSAGWVVTALGFWIGAALVAIGVMIARRHHADPGYDPFLASALVGTGLGVGTTLMAAGFLFFECFAYLGARRCRFANRTRPDAHTSS